MHRIFGEVDPLGPAGMFSASIVPSTTRVWLTAPWPCGNLPCTVPLSVHLKTHGSPTQISRVPFENTQPLFSDLPCNLPNPLGESLQVQRFLCRARPLLYVGAQFSVPVWLGEMDLLFWAPPRTAVPSARYLTGGSSRSVYFAHMQAAFWSVPRAHLWPSAKVRG